MISLSPVPHELERYFRVIEEGTDVRSHLDLLRWLQGGVQHYLPHEIMLALWCDIRTTQLRHDLVSIMRGVRTSSLSSENFLVLQRTLYAHWVELGKEPFRLSLDTGDFLFTEGSLSALGEAMQNMRSLLVHGINDERGGQDCLYILFSSNADLNESVLGIMGNLLPHLDAASCRIAPFARQHHVVSYSADMPKICEDSGLSAREIEILHWVRMGKINSEIASILEISTHTVKNHMQNIFRKLDVSNRMQAISKTAPALSIGEEYPGLSFSFPTMPRDHLVGAIQD